MATDTKSMAGKEEEEEEEAAVPVVVNSDRGISAISLRRQRYSLTTTTASIDSTFTTHHSQLVGNS